MTLRRALKKKDQIKATAEELRDIISKKLDEKQMYKLFVDEILGFDSSMISETEDEVMEF